MNFELPTNSTSDEVIEWLQRLVRDFGIGFHPDTPAEDYTTPTGSRSLTPDECVSLNRSIILLFSILGDELPYTICANEAKAILANRAGAKRPLHYHDPSFQQRLLRDGSREEVIEWLCWNDPNGTYTDVDSAAEDCPPLSIDQARQIMSDQIERERFC